MDDGFDPGGNSDDDVDICGSDTMVVSPAFLSHDALDGSALAVVGTEDNTAASEETTADDDGTAFDTPSVARSVSASVRLYLDPPVRLPATRKK